jgi:hypothetical protein
VVACGGGLGERLFEHLSPGRVPPARGTPSSFVSSSNKNNNLLFIKTKVILKKYA